MADENTPNEVPTKGDCYEASVKNAAELVEIQKLHAEGNPDAEGIFEMLHLGGGDVHVVHGWATPKAGPVSGKRIHHAWIEIGDYVVETQGGTRRQHPKKEYYSEFSVEVERIYTVAEAQTFSARYGYASWAKIISRG